MGKGEIARNEQFTPFPAAISTLSEAFPPFSSHLMSKMDFLPNRVFCHKYMMTLRGDVLRETTPSSMDASRFKYNT